MIKYKELAKAKIKLSSKWLKREERLYQEFSKKILNMLYEENNSKGFTYGEVGLDILNSFQSYHKSIKIFRKRFMEENPEYFI